jgi:hypothetical protein
MRITLHQKEATVSTTEDSNSARELVGQVTSILREHRSRMPGPWLRSFAWAIGGTLYGLVLVLSAVVQFEKGNDGWFSIVLASVLVPMSLLVSIAAWVSRKRQGGAVVLPVNREEDRSRRTGWRVGVVTSLVGALVGTIATLLIQSLTGH